MYNYNCANILEDDIIAKLADFGLPMELPQVSKGKGYSMLLALPGQRDTIHHNYIGSFF